MWDKIPLKDVNAQDDLAALSSTLLKMTIMEEHSGYAKYVPSKKGSCNSRNDYTKKFLKVIGVILS